eukprot:m.253960 g.253960  ORF g.253960 m.253960 type:complete len:52 (+) comp18674_c0_seq1:1171-1326(+)
MASEALRRSHQQTGTATTTLLPYVLRSVHLKLVRVREGAAGRNGDQKRFFE